MVLKKFCDTCGVEIKDHCQQATYTDSSSLLEGRRIELCRTCGSKVRDFISDLEQEQDQLRAMMKKIAESGKQMTIDDFHDYY